MQRKVIGEPKAGLNLQIWQAQNTMTLNGRPDPLLLYVVLAASVVMGAVGGVVFSPKEGVVSFLAFALLFSPLITVLVFNAVRVKTLCTLDLERGVLEIEEQSYTRRVRELYPLDEIGAVVVRRLPSAPFAGGTSCHGIFLALRNADYLAACSYNESAVNQDAWRVSRFLGIPLETLGQEVPERTASHSWLIITTAAIYVVPVVAAVLILLLFLNQLSTPEPTLVGLMGAVVISQIGAMIAFAFYRTRRPYES
ncbi:MAG: hypothetical protein QOF51_3213 [Chloroflexota bacterium]|nr:hypothetical protein [Chloroflexota bacterium]